MLDALSAVPRDPNPRWVMPDALPNPDAHGRVMYLPPRTPLTALPDPDPRTDVPTAAIERIEAAEVRRRLRCLPPFDRMVILLRYGIAGAPELSCRETAQRLGVSVGMVHKVEHRALDQLRRHYDAAGAEAA